MSEAETEQKIVAAGLNAPRLSPAALVCDQHALWFLHHWFAFGIGES